MEENAKPSAMLCVKCSINFVNECCHCGIIYDFFPMEVAPLWRTASRRQMLCFICPLMYLEMVTVGILNAIEKQMKPMRYNIIDAVLREVGLIWLFVPLGGI